MSIGARLARLEGAGQPQDALAIKGLETEDMLARIEALEARAEQPAISGNPGLRKVV